MQIKNNEILFGKGGGANLEMTEPNGTGNFTSMADYIFSNVPIDDNSVNTFSGIINSSGAHCFFGYIYPNRQYGAVIIFNAWGSMGKYRRTGSTTTIDF